MALTESLQPIEIGRDGSKFNSKAFIKQTTNRKWMRQIEDWSNFNLKLSYLSFSIGHHNLELG